MVSQKLIRIAWMVYNTHAASSIIFGSAATGTLHTILVGMYFSPPSAIMQPSVSDLKHKCLFLPFSGSILAALDTFKKMWVSKQEYDENGQRAIDQKTF